MYSLQGAALIPVSPGPCLCPDGWYPFPDVSSCLRCLSVCLTCQDGGENSCATCALQAELKMGMRVCLQGYYPSSDAKSCFKCDYSCQHCNGSSAKDCISCPALATLANGVCVCSSGLMRNKDLGCVLREQFTAELSSESLVILLQFSSTLAADLRPESVTVDV